LWEEKIERKKKKREGGNSQGAESPSLACFLITLSQKEGEKKNCGCLGGGGEEPTTPFRSFRSQERRERKGGGRKLLCSCSSFTREEKRPKEKRSRPRHARRRICGKETEGRKEGDQVRISPIANGGRPRGKIKGKLHDSYISIEAKEKKVRGRETANLISNHERSQRGRKKLGVAKKRKEMPSLLRSRMISGGKGGKEEREGTAAILLSREEDKNSVRKKKKKKKR